jgi:N-acetylglucosaminyldiphosphoundecaprenol N-acetyl-beta-D-mannosaminyltransferase
MQTNSNTAVQTRDQVLGYPVDLVSETAAVEIIKQAWVARKQLHVVTINAEMVVASQQDKELDRIIRSAGLVVPDGAGVVWALRLAEAKNARVMRLPGIELAAATLAAAAASGETVALVGGRPEVMNKLVEELPRLHPGLKIVAYQNGFYDKEKEEQVVETLAHSNPSLILVALGVPRQEYFIDRWKHRFGQSVMIGVGGSFDVWTGFVQRAPESFQKFHCEWLYRLIKEPWRFSRMANSLPNFAFQALSEIVSKRTGQKK